MLQHLTKKIVKLNNTKAQRLLAYQNEVPKESINSWTSQPLEVAGASVTAKRLQ